MSWTTPATAIAGSILTASWLNTYLRDNMNLLKTSIADDGTMLKPVMLIHSGSGTSSATSPTTVDSVALSGLTANDRLFIHYECVSTVQATASLAPLSVTDNVLFPSFGPIAVNETVSAHSKHGPQPGNTSVIASLTMLVGNVALGGIIPTNNIVQAVSTPWTSPWTLGLRHGGVTSGGTFKWAWSVFKEVG